MEDQKNSIFSSFQFPMSSNQKITKKQVFAQLKRVIDPELGIDIVSIGLIYEVKVKQLRNLSHSTKLSSQSQLSSTAQDSIQQYQVYIRMTLTSPGCPLIDVIESNIKSELDKIRGLNGYRDVEIELTFNPPWTMDMMDEVAKAELGF